MPPLSANGTSRLATSVLPLLSLLVILPLHLGAQTARPASTENSAQTGTVYGRVLNSATGQYLNNATVSVKGTNLVAFTDVTGTYRLVGVPVGQIILDVAFTGMDTKQAVVNMAGATAVEQNIELAGASNRDAADVQKMSEFVVTAKPMEGSAIAIQEQRVAPNIKNVVSADEFGLVPDGNVGEFLKLIPGVVMSYRGGDPREIYLNGAPSTSVPITIDGFGLASSEISGTGRNVELNDTSVNTLSRVEAILSITPDTPASALAGTINLVPRSAFERLKPEFKYTAYLASRDYTTQFGRTKGPMRDATYKVRPGADFSWTVPVNKRFGFTLSAGASSQYLENSTANETWRGSGAVTNGTGFPDTTPDKPYLSDITVGVQWKIAERSSLGVTADYRIGPGSTLTFSFQFGTLHTEFSQRNQMFYAVNPDNTGQAASRPAAFDPGFTHGGTGRGEVRLQTAYNNRFTQTWMPSLHYRYNGGSWLGDAGVGYSEAQNTFRNVNKGVFQTTVARRTNVTVSFDDIEAYYMRPGTITVTDGTTGAPVDPFNLNSYVLNSGNGNQQTKNSFILTSFANATRRFNGRWPLSIKAGLQMDENVNDNTSTSTGPLTYVGPDGVASTTPVGSDDNAGQYYDPNFFQRTYLFGIPRIPWVDNQAAYENFKAHPGYWTGNANTLYRNQISASKHSNEIVSAAFVRGDIELFERRLLLNGGVRGEQTNVKARGPLTDPTRNFRRDSSGNVLRDASGNPLTLSSDPLTVSQLTFIERGYEARKEYFRLFPSLNARYMIRENLIARAAYYQSIGRPDFNQYSGGITLPNLESSPSASNSIQVNNAAIKPWTASTYKVSLEYYFQHVGLVSVGAFRRDYRNFFGSTTFAPTPRFLDLYGLDDATYGRYNVSTQTNLTNVLKTQGVDFNYKQSLTFLPHWGRGVQVFANASFLRFRNFTDVSGASVAINNFSLFVPRSTNWGVSLTRPTFNVRLNCNYVSRTRQSLLTGRGIESNTFVWQPSRTYFDLSGEYSLSRRVALFGTIRNLGDQPEDQENYGPSTPSHSVFRQRNDFGTLFTVGVKGTF